MLEDRLHELRNYYRLERRLGIGWSWLPFRRRWLKKKARKEGGRSWILLENGLLAPVDVADRATHRLWLRGRLAPDLAWAIDRYARPGSVAVDVGANLGYVSLLLVGRVGPEGRVIAIEPHPSLLHRLQSLARLNRLENLEIHSCASSDREGMARFAPEASDHTRSRLSPGGEVHVPVRTLDSILAETPGPVSFLKIDVEGHEREVLLGAERTIAKHRPVIVFEVCGHSGEEIAGIRDFFARTGYEVVGILRDWGLEARGLSAGMAGPTRSGRRRSGRSHLNVLALPEDPRRP